MRKAKDRLSIIHKQHLKKWPTLFGPLIELRKLAPKDNNVLNITYPPYPIAWLVLLKRKVFWIYFIDLHY